MISVKVAPDNAEPYYLTATARDVLVWEKTTKGNKTFLGFMASLNLVDLYRIAHIAAWRQQLFTGNLEEFEKTCEVTFEEEEQEAEPDPTHPGPSAGPSSPSPSEPASPPARGRKKANARS